MRAIFQTPKLTRRRIATAMAIALIADGLQILFAPFVVVDELIDIVAMVLTIYTIGFHPLLLPTFIVELVPFVEMLPTWSACVGAVIFLKKRNQASEPIDVTVTSERVSDPKP